MVGEAIAQLRSIWKKKQNSKKKTTMTECEFNCSEEAVTKLKYDEAGTPVKYKWACREHANMEQIHDPFNIREVAVS